MIITQSVKGMQFQGQAIRNVLSHFDQGDVPDVEVPDRTGMRIPRTEPLKKEEARWLVACIEAEGYGVKHVRTG